MKKIAIKISALAFLLSLAFLNISCGGGHFILVKLFCVEIYDENDNVISKKEDLENFEVSQIDNYSGRKFDGKIFFGKANQNEYCYGLFFYLGMGKFVSTEQRYERRFKKQMEKTGIRIVDKQGRYKTYEIYPLSDYYECSDGVKPLIVKLERK